MGFYFTVGSDGYAEYKDRGSKFLGYCYPVKSPEDFKTRMQFLKKEHPKAVHHSFAYRIGYDENNFRTSDDGEPAGTAGKPILGQIDSKNLTDTLIVVVRYFGGTLLGIPGLINAYKTSASLVLQCTPIVQKPIEENFVLEFDYTSVNEVMLILKRYNCTIQKNEIQLFCKIETGIPVNKKDEILSALGNLPNIAIGLVKK